MTRRIELPTDPEALGGFELEVPNMVDGREIERLVDQVLRALVECEYVAEYRTFNVRGAKLARYRAVGGEPGFVKRTYDGRIGWRTISKSREDIREELIRWLSSATSRARNRSHNHYVEATDEFVVAPVENLRGD